MAFDYRKEYHRYRQYYVNLQRIYEKPAIRVSVFVLLSFVIVIFFSLFAIQPTLTTVSQLVREIEDKQQINDRLGTKVTTLDSLQGLMLTIQQDIPLILNLIPEDFSTGRLIQEMEYVAQLNDVSVLSVQFKPIILDDKISQAGELQRLNFNLSVGGSFEGVRNFIDTLEKLDRLLVLSEVDFISGAENFQRRGFAAISEITGEAYYLQSEVEVANEEV